MRTFNHETHATNHYLIICYSSEGFPETEETFSIISSVYIMTFTLGNSIGPFVAGALVDTVKFQKATLFVVVLSALVV